MEDERELHADSACAHDHDRLRQLPAEDLLFEAHHAVALRDAGQLTRRRAGCHDCVLEGDRLDGAAGGHDLDRVRVQEGSSSVDLGDAVLLHEVVDAFDVVLGHLPAAVPCDAEVELHVSTDAELGSTMEYLMRQVGVLEESLRRDASHVEAHAAPILLLHDGSREAELSGPDCCDVTARSCTQNYDIIRTHGHTLRTDAIDRIAVSHRGRTNSRSRPSRLERGIATCLIGCPRRHRALRR